MQHPLVKSIVNAPHWLTLSTILLLSASLSGCGTFSFGREKVKPVEVVTKPVERAPLAIEQPDPIKTKPIRWFVITPDNVQEVFQKMEEEGTELVLFALTDEGYEQLSLTIADLRNLINTQRQIIIKYKEYYESN